MVAHLPGKHEGLSLSPGSTKTKTKAKQIQVVIVSGLTLMQPHLILT
jgi:hypothetical protein